MSELSTADLSRIESFGDNCELGFVLRRLGCEDGMLFRWTSIQPDSLLATLRDDFAELYAFDNLVAHRDKMVLDRRYGTAWHSGMVSGAAEGGRVFIHDEAERRAIHAAEELKRSHLVEKLRRKFKHPNPVFVLKCREEVSASLVEELHYQLYRRVESPEFVLLDVRVDPDRAGEVDVVGRTLLRGYVTRFASYESADDGDDGAWHRILAQALAHHAGTQPDRKPAQAFADIILPFPLEHEPSLAQVLPGDLRAGLVRLHHGSIWCRSVYDDLYRLHAGAIGDAATVLQWTGVHLPPSFTIEFHAECAIADSKPVRATLTAQDGEGRSVRQSSLINPGKLERVAVRGAWGGAGALTVRLAVEPLEPLVGSERAVIDLQPIVCRPVGAPAPAEAVAV